MSLKLRSCYLILIQPTRTHSQTNGSRGSPMNSIARLPAIPDALPMHMMVGCKYVQGVSGHTYVTFFAAGGGFQCSLVDFRRLSQLANGG